jgi:hypothetical protein
MERGREAEFIFEERAPEGVAVLDGAVDVERGLHFHRLVTLQFFFGQHSKLEQTINTIIFLIVNNVLYFSTPPRVKMTKFILCFLMNTSTNHTLLQLTIIVLDKHISLVSHPALRSKPDAHHMYAQDQVIIHTTRM